MQWLLQDNYVETMTGRLAWALRRTGREIISFSLVPDKDFPQLDAEPSLPHFFYGSTGMLRRLRQSSAWGPYLFDTEQALDQRHWQVHRAADMLNPSFETLTLAELHAKPFTTPYFVRPVVAQKAFAGQVVRSQDLSSLYQGRKGIVHAHPDDLLLAVSPVAEAIAAEYRFIVLDHQVRLGSRYRLDGQLSLSEDIPVLVWNQAQALAEGWLPAKFIVMDMALLSDGSARIVEFNSVHSSGLYAMRGEAMADLVEEAVHARISCNEKRT
jgi:hypothetical protein